MGMYGKINDVRLNLSTKKIMLTVEVNARGFLRAAEEEKEKTKSVKSIQKIAKELFIKDMKVSRLTLSY